MDIVRLVLSSSKNSWDGAGSNQGKRKETVGWQWHLGWGWSKSWHVTRGSAQLQMEDPHLWDTFLPATAGAAQLAAARSINCNTFLKVSMSQVKAAQNYHNHKLCCAAIRALVREAGAWQPQPTGWSH